MEVAFFSSGSGSEVEGLWGCSGSVLVEEWLHGVPTMAEEAERRSGGGGEALWVCGGAEEDEGVFGGGVNSSIYLIWHGRSNGEADNRGINDFSSKPISTVRRLGHVAQSGARPPSK